MPKILYFVNIPRFFVSHRLPLAVAAKNAGYEVHVATADDDAENIARIRDAGLIFHPLPLEQHSINPFKELRVMLAIAAVYRQLKPDIVHLVSVKPIIYGGIMARLMRLPAIVCSVSGLGYGFAEKQTRFDALQVLQKYTYKLALDYHRCHIIFQNPDDMARFSKILVHDASHLNLIRGSGVDMHYFSPQPEASEPPVILFAGRLMWKKGLGDFLEAARRLKGRARFAIAGYVEATHPDIVSLEQIQAWESEALIEYWGKRDDMPQAFAESHIVCLPSTYGEGVPKVLIEAAACGRPIVTTDMPGCREITHDGENGLLVPPNDVDALTQALEKLIDNSDLRQMMGRKGREIAQEGYSLQKVLDETLALYKNLLK